MKYCVDGHVRYEKSIAKEKEESDVEVFKKTLDGKTAKGLMVPGSYIEHRTDKDGTEYVRFLLMFDEKEDSDLLVADAKSEGKMGKSKALDGSTISKYTCKDDGTDPKELTEETI